MKYSASPITIGKTIRSADIGGFVLTESAHTPSLEVPPHFHESASMMFVIDGSFLSVFGSRSQECHPLSLLVKPAGEVHSSHYGQAGAQCLLIEVKPQRLEEVRAFSRVLDRVLHHEQGVMATLAMKIYREFRAMDGASPLSIEGLMFEMLAQGTRMFSNTSFFTIPSWLQRARDFIHEHFTQHISLSTVAESVGVHPAHLAKLFQRHYHCTVGDYVRHLQLDYAIQELAHSNKSLTEIALAAGFYDQSHFTRAFKLSMGISPARFRASIKADKNGTKKTTILQDSI